MKKIYITLFLLGFGFCLNTQAQTSLDAKPSFTRLDKIIAVVNKEVITQSQLNKEIEQVTRQLEHTNQPIPEPGIFRKEVLDSLIAKSLQMQLCKARGIRASEEEVDKTIKNIAKGNNISVEKLKEAVTQTGLNYDVYRAQIRDQITLQKLQQEEVAKKITFTEEDVKKFLRENKSKLNQYSTYHVVDVVFPVSEGSKPEDINQAKQQALAFVKQLETGDDIDTAIKRYPTAEKNDLGFRPLPEYPSLFQAKIATLKINNVASPTQAPNGFHVLKLLEAKGTGMQLTDKDAKNLAFQQKVTEGIREWVKTLRSEAYVKINN